MCCTVQLVRSRTVMRLVLLACVRNGVAIAMQFEVAAMAWGWLGCSAAVASMASSEGTPRATLELPKLIPLEELVLLHNIAAALVADAQTDDVAVLRLV